MSDTPLMENTTEQGSLFDTLAQLVPEELQKDSYRVVAHVQTLSPDDEMLCILEAMGVLALIIRQTPGDIAMEREQIEALLDRYLQLATTTQNSIVEFGKDIDNRLSNLPKEIEAGLNPERISKLLGEALRQHLTATGIKETVASVESTVATLQKVQQQLTTTLKGVGDPRYGFAVQVEESNRRIIQSVESRSAEINGFLHELWNDLMKVWVPVIVCASLSFGFAGGMSLQRWRDDSAAPQVTIQEPLPTTLSTPVIPPVSLSSKPVPKQNK